MKIATPNMKRETEDYRKALIKASPAPQLVFVVRYLDDDRGWLQTAVRAANEDEARSKVDGPVASIHQVDPPGTV